MAAAVDQAYRGWSCQELPGRDASEEVSVSPMLDHDSISFGRFAVESLSWEKKSVFTRNRRQEELEKFSTRGLVAQKKAYFEEYYKRIRAVKSLQDNRQSEVTMDHGEDVSFSSQFGKENEAAVELKSHGDGAANIGNDHLEGGPTGVSISFGHLEELATGVALEKATHPSEALQDSYLDMQPLKSSRKCFEEIKEKNCSDRNLQMQHLNSKLVKDEAYIRSEQNIDRHDISSLDGKGVSDRNANLSFTDKSPIVVKGTAPFARNPKPERSKLTQVENATREKVSQSIKTYNKESMPVPKFKNPSSVRNNLNLDSKKKSLLKLSNGLNPVQRTVGKAENSTRSRNAADDKLSISHTSASISSCKPLTEGCSKVTIPRPFSFATEKRAATPSRLRDATPRLASKSSNTAASLTHEKGITNFQSISEKPTTMNAVRGRILESKRGFEKRMPLVLDSRHISLKRKDASMLVSSKARSINLPRGNRPDPYSGSNNHAKSCSAKGSRGEEGNDQAKLMQKIDVFSSRNAASVLIRNLMEENRKSWTSNSLLDTGKPRSSNRLLNAKKSRLEMTQWR